MTRLLSSFCNRTLRGVASASAALLLSLAIAGQANAVTINFDDLPAAPSATEGSSVPVASQLTDQYASLGVLFESLGGFATIVNLGTDSPTSPNAIAGSTRDGLLTYAVPIHLRFVSPTDPSIPAVTTSVSIRGDLAVSGLGTNTMIALDVAGNPVAFDIKLEPPASLLTVSGIGIHEVILIGTGSTAFDDLTFADLQVVPEPSSVALVVIGTIVLLATRFQYRAKKAAKL